MIKRVLVSSDVVDIVVCERNVVGQVRTETANVCSGLECKVSCLCFALRPLPVRRDDLICFTYFSYANIIFPICNHVYSSVRVC